MALVLIHEAGHMVVAKACGMRVERFSIFFGKPIWSFRKGETEYGIGWLPLGGYVKISGMTRGEEVPPEHEHRTYYNAKPWKRIATILAGPAVNIVVAFLVFAVVFWIGPGQIIATNNVASVRQDSPAAAIGLMAGDRIESVNGISIAGGQERLVQEIRGNLGQPITVGFSRGEELIEREVRPTRLQLEDGSTVVGIGFNFRVQRVDGPSSGFFGGFADAGRFTWELVRENGKAIGQIFTSEEARDNVGSVVAIGAVYNEVSEQGWETVMRYIGYISLILGIFNLLPLLPLDGGHILFTIIEKIKGSALPRRAYEGAAVFGLILIAFIFIFAVQNDIGKLAGEGFGTTP